MISLCRGSNGFQQSIVLVNKLPSEIAPVNVTMKIAPACQYSIQTNVDKDSQKLSPLVLCYIFIPVNKLIS